VTYSPRIRSDDGKPNTEHRTSNIEQINIYYELPLKIKALSFNGRIIIIPLPSDPTRPLRRTAQSIASNGAADDTTDVTS
jgi:hypothetical protein